MLSPKKLKYRKSHCIRLKRLSKNGSMIAFGEHALVATGYGRITSRQIESARVAMTRKIKRGGRVWIKIFPHLPITKKPLEVRMGNGKGPVEYYVANIEPGKVLYEMGDITYDIAKDALKLAAAKLPLKTKIINKNINDWKI